MHQVKQNKTRIIKNVKCHLLNASGKKIQQVHKVLVALTFITGVLISLQPDQEGNKLGSMSGTRAISTTSRRQL